MSDENEGLPPAPRPDFSQLSIGDMLTRLQRRHIENLLTLAEADELPNDRVLAQINRYLMDNGVIVLPSDVPKVIEGHVEERPALPDFTGTDYE